MTRLRHGDAYKGRVARLHNIWRGMLKRCNPNLATPNPKYAGRGIKVCGEWRTYETFRDWAYQAGYADDLTIERRDNNGDYCPGNCTWISSAEQAANRRTTHNLTFNGRTMHLSRWAREVGIQQSLLSFRLRYGWSVERALTTPPDSRRGMRRAA